MIRVRRDGIPAPKSLLAKNPKRAKEFRDAAKHYGSKATMAKAFPFEVFKAADVREALARLFNDKCAYCESKLGTQPLAVEHYRPKSGFTDQNGKLARPGYWWLAAEWENLLPSCTDCNGLRKKQNVDLFVTMSGKGNHFPLRDETHRWRHPKQNREKPLLLDPTVRDPEDHLSFQLSRQGAVLPKTRGKKEDPIGRATIDLLGLNRKVLAQLRKSMLRMLELNLRFLDTAVQKKDTANRNLILQELGSRCAPGEPFALMMRQVIRAHVKGLGLGAPKW